MVEVGGRRYKPIISLNHAEVIASMIDAHSSPPGVVVWQALCQRAELIAHSFTPAEIVAVVRIVSERQAGQLKLMWTLASVTVEKLASFTADDLVAITSAYSSLPTVHEGLLNVT